MKKLRISELTDQNARKESAIKRALEHFDMRAELYTNDQDVAAGMADILRETIKEKPR